MIIRGTTQTHYFEFPFNQTEVKNLSVVYFQNKYVKIRKELSDVEFDDGSLVVKLSQEDTYGFDHVGIPSIPVQSLIKIQIKILLNDGSVYVSDPIRERLYDVLEEEVIE